MLFYVLIYLMKLKRKGIDVNLKLLSERLGIPVVGTIAKNKKL